MSTMVNAGTLKDQLLRDIDKLAKPDIQEVLDFVEFLQIKRCKTEDVTPEDIKERQVLVAQMKEFGQRLVGRQINLGDLILKSREDLEKRV
ncbi:MAG: hypothetical protein Q8M92_06985 [Candidatus Subteraquimicrobiales bacterium]|nr:hypothetical protein [Candidatus Subteraquimicrobiales bacterium]